LKVTMSGYSNIISMCLNAVQNGIRACQVLLSLRKLWGSAARLTCDEVRLNESCETQ